MEDEKSQDKFADHQRFFTIAEAAGILKLSRSGLYRLLQSGKIKAIQLGRLRRIPASELSRLAKQRD
jgi:excisionase family DNA binding protein